MTHNQTQEAPAAARQPTRQPHGQPGSDSLPADESTTSQQMQAQPLQQQPLAWWQPLLLLLLKPLTACWKVREVVLEVVLQVVLAVPALVVLFPVLFMWLIVHVAIKMHRWQHRHQPLSALFLFKVAVFPFWFYPLFFLGESVTWTFSPNNNGIAHQGRAG
jgi:hypothetical protein